MNCPNLVLFLREYPTCSLRCAQQSPQTQLDMEVHAGLAARASSYTILRRRSKPSRPIPRGESVPGSGTDVEPLGFRTTLSRPFELSLAGSPLMKSGSRPGCGKRRGELLPGLDSRGRVGVGKTSQRRTADAAKQDIDGARCSENTPGIMNVSNPECLTLCRSSLQRTPSPLSSAARLEVWPSGDLLSYSISLLP